MTIHKTLIAQILETIPGTKTHGFRKATIDAVKRTQGKLWGPDREEEFREDLAFIPDAYSIDRQARSVTIYEVEVEHHLKGEKLGAVIYAWFALDCVEWKMRLIVINRFGTHSEVNLCDEYHKQIDERYLPKPSEPPPPIPVFRPEKRKPRNRKTFWWERC